MKDIDKNMYAALLDQIKRNPSLLEKLQKDIIAEPSLYQKNSKSDFTSEDNRRLAVLVLDWIYANKAYPREIIADTRTGHIGFKNEAGTILSKTKELEDRLNDLFGDGEGATGNDIKVEIEDLIGKTLGEALKENRLRCNMTQEFVAETLGVSRQAVSKWENGTSEPNTTNLIALSRLYKIEAVDLLECIQEKEPV